MIKNFSISFSIIYFLFLSSIFWMRWKTKLVAWCLSLMHRPYIFLNLHPSSISVLHDICSITGPLKCLLCHRPPDALSSKGTQDACSTKDLQDPCSNNRANLSTMLSTVMSVKTPAPPEVPRHLLHQKFPPEVPRNLLHQKFQDTWSTRSAKTPAVPRYLRCLHLQRPTRHLLCYYTPSYSVHHAVHHQVYPIHLLYLESQNCCTSKDKQETCSSKSSKRTTPPSFDKMPTPPKTNKILASPKAAKGCLLWLRSLRHLLWKKFPIHLFHYP